MPVHSRDHQSNPPKNEVLAFVQANFELAEAVSFHPLARINRTSGDSGQRHGRHEPESNHENHQKRQGFNFVLFSC